MSQYIIQLGLLSKEDDRLWWLDPYLWDLRDDAPDTVTRPTEVLALRGLFRQARLIRKKGLSINLSPWHIEALQWEYHCRREYPHFAGKEYQWVSEQMGVPQLQVKALLDECSLAVLMRDLLHMPPLIIDWNGGTLVKRTVRKIA